jgi:NAD-dependent deacetylase
MPAPDTLREKSEKLLEMIRRARFCIAFTGAGVSTLSGIQDFRGKNGINQDGEGEKIFDLDNFIRDPAYYYRATVSFIYNLKEKEASLVHTTLGKMEEQGLLRGIITQNIDLLHQKGGCKGVVEIHGSPVIHYCRHCSDPALVEALAFPGPEAAGPPAIPAGGDLMGFEEAAALVQAGELPRCGRCGGVLKPAITFYGEALPARAMRAAQNLARKADLMLILGTSLTVYPAAALPLLTLDAGGRVVIVNNMATSLDRRAALTFDELEPLFTLLDAALSGPPGKGL